MAEVKTNLAMKLHKVMSSIGEVPKTGYNKGQNYPYHTDSDILGALKPLLEKERLLIIPSLDWDHNMPAVTKDGNLTTVYTKYTVIDVDSGEERVVYWSGQGADPGDKGANKAFTASGKYAMIKLFMIESEEDADASSGEYPAAPAKPAYTTSPPKAAATQTTAATPPAAAKPAATKPAAARPASEHCELCEKGVPPGVAGYSKTNFKGHVFCMDCQHKVDKDSLEEAG